MNKNQTVLSVKMCDTICCQTCKQFDTHIIPYLKKHCSFSPEAIEQVQNLTGNVIRALCLLITQEFATYDELIEHIWEGRMIGAGSLPVVMHEVRHFLKKCPNVNVVNVRNKGYMLVIKS